MPNRRDVDAAAGENNKLRSLLDRILQWQGKMETALGISPDLTGTGNPEVFAAPPQASLAITAQNGAFQLMITNPDDIQVPLLVHQIQSSTTLPFEASQTIIDYGETSQQNITIVDPDKTYYWRFRSRYPMGSWNGWQTYQGSSDQGTGSTAAAPPSGAGGGGGGDSIPLLPPNHITDIHLAPTGVVTTLETVPSTAAAWAPGYLRNEGTTGNWIISIGGNTPSGVSYSIKLGPGDSTLGTMGEGFKEAVLPVGTIKAFHDAPGGGGAGVLSGYIAWNDGTSPLAGPTGPAGPYGGPITFDYKFSTVTADADPGVGNFSLNNATQQTATQLFFDLVSFDGKTLTTVLDGLISSSNPVLQFWITKKSDVTKWLYFRVTAWTTATGYRKFTLANVAFSGANPFANSDECLILVGFPGNIASRASTVLVTGVLGSSATETGTVNLAKTFACAKVTASALCRIRLYSTSAARTADASRLTTIQPPIGTQHGVIMDLVLDTSDKLTWIMSPLAYGANCESSPSIAISYSIQNLSGVSQALTITFTFTSEEF